MARFTQEQLYAPCPCGSGKKLKFCCVNAVKVAHPDDAVVDRAADQLERGNFTAARLILEPLFVQGTTSIRAYNGRALIALHDGDEERALDLTREVWTSLAPGHAYAGALLAHSLAATGHVVEANAIADRLLHVPMLDPTHTHQVVLAFGALGRDADVAAVAARGPEPHTNIVDAVTAVALVNLRRFDEARSALRRTLARTPDAGRYLEVLLYEIERGRTPAMPFGRLATLPINAWLPGGNTQAVVMEMARHPERTVEIVKRYPILVELYKQMATTPDMQSRQTALLQLGRLGQRDALFTIIDSGFGTDDDRFCATRALIENKLVDDDHVFRMRFRGKVQEVRVSGREIGLTPEQHDTFAIPAHLQDEYHRAIELDRAGKGARAMEALAKKAPNHPVMRFNALAARMINERPNGEGLAELRAIVDEFPDYLFARATLANVLLGDERVGDADALLSHDHIAAALQPEWAALALVARARIEMLKKNFEGAAAAAESAAKMGFDIEARAPDVALLKNFAKMQRRVRERIEAKEEKARRRHVRLDAPFDDWFAHYTVDELKRIAKNVGIRGATRRAELLAGLDVALGAREHVDGLVRRLSSTGRAAWDELVAAGGAVAHDAFVGRHGENGAMGELCGAALAVVAAVEGMPTVAIPRRVRETMGIGRPTLPESGRHTSAGAGTWSVGVVQMPLVRIGGGEQTPIIAVVVGDDGRVIAQTVGKPDARRELVASAFTQARATARPKMIVALDDDIAGSLVRAGARADDVIVGPSEQLDAVSLLLRFAMAGSQSYLESGASELEVRSLFEAAADLYVSAPWGFVPDDSCLFRIFAPDRAEIVAAVIGQLGEEHGVVLFDSVTACRRWRESVEALDAGTDVNWAPTVTALNFERKDAVTSALRDEIRAQGWRLAGPAAFPLVFRTGPGFSPEPPTRDDFEKLEIAARVVVAVLRDRNATWPPGEVRDVEVAVATGAARVRVEFAVAE
jgi:hypothetical protein